MIDMLYRRSRIRRQRRRRGAARRAGRSSPRARGATELTSRGQRHREAAVRAAGLRRRSGAISSRIDDEWLGNTTMSKTLGAEPRRRRDIESRSDDPRTPLSLRHDVARRRADDRRRFLASTTSATSPRCSTSSASTMSRAAIPAPIRSTPNSSRRKPTKRARFCAFGMTKRPGRSAANDPGVAGLLAADADAIVFVAKTLGLSRPCRARLHARGEPRGHRATACARRSPRAARRWSIASISSTATRPIPTMRCNARSAAYRRRRALGGAVRHQRRHAAARDRAHRARGRASRSPASGSASTPITTPTTPSPIRSPRSAPACGRCRAR